MPRIMSIANNNNNMGNAKKTVKDIPKLKAGKYLL